MAIRLRRYEFSERLAQILGESRRDLRFRVTMLVSGGLVAPGPRGRGSPPATPQYAARLLLGAMAAPRQSDTVEAVHCYERLRPGARTGETQAPRIRLGPGVAPDGRCDPPTPPLLSGHRTFGDVLAALLELAAAAQTRESLAQELFGIWVSRSFPVSAVQLGTWIEGQRRILTQRYELPEGVRPPAWLDPERDGNADPGLFHTVFLPASKLLEIGKLTSLTDKERSPMINLGPKLASVGKLAELVRQSNHRGRWEKLLETLATVQAWSDQVDIRDSRLVEVRGFGSNPGQLRMLTYVPEGLPPGAPLVVILHGCTQTAASFDKGTGWSTLAHRFGFALLVPEQHWTNNPLRCFNWFRPEDTRRDSGEALSINQMIDHMIRKQGLDRRRVYVTGLSSGGAMTSVMLATYPDVFAGGAVLSGVPYRAADSMQEAFASIFQGQSRTPQAWGDLVREASSHRGPWPKVSVWHGDADAAVAPMNADEIVKQWTDVHGLAGAPHIEQTLDGHPHRVWRGRDGEHLVESLTIRGMSHGAALSTGDQPHQCGTAAPFFNDIGVSSAYQIARFWGLLERELEVADAESRPSAVRRKPDVIDLSRNTAIEGFARLQAEGEAAGMGADDLAPESRRSVEGRPEPGDSAELAEAPARGVLVEASEPGPSPADADGAAGPSDPTGWGAAPFGIDVHGILRQSLAAAGLVKAAEPEGGEARRRGAMPLGIDIPGIIGTSLEAAGVLRGRAAGPESGVSGHDAEVSSWEGEGWELLVENRGGYRDGPLLFGQVSSGRGCDLGKKVCSTSRRVSLGPRPELSYVRRLNLNAAVNDYTSARFSVLVDGVAVDEASAVGMEHVEAEWLQRSDIDLARFADRTVTLTFEVAASSNVCTEVSAKAWVDRIRIKTVSPLC